MPSFHLLKQQKNNSLCGGFTLLELIVALGIFSLIGLAASDIMISVFRAQAKAKHQRTLLDEMRFSLELMTKELRTGANFQSVSLCGGINGLQFTSFNQIVPQERFYYWSDTDGDANPDALMRVAMPIAEPIDCALAQQFTAEEINIDQAVIILSGEQPGPLDGQPRITLSLRGRLKDPHLGPETVMNVQTTITPRQRDIPL